MECKRCGFQTTEGLALKEARAELHEHYKTEHAGVFQEAGRRGGQRRAENRARERAEPPEEEDEGERPARAGRNGKRPAAGAAKGMAGDSVLLRSETVPIKDVVRLRWETWCEHGYTGDLAEFINEATAIVTEIKGLVPLGYFLEEDRDAGEYADAAGDGPNSAGGGDLGEPEAGVKGLVPAGGGQG